MSISLASAILVAVRRELARRTFLKFIQAIDSEFQVVKHHKLLASVVDAVIAGDEKRVMISLPPRHSKSEMFSILFSLYFFGLFPGKKIMHISYAANLSNEFSRRVRDVVANNHAYHRLFPKTRLDPTKQAVGEWQTTQGGGFLSTGARAGISGRGADVLLMDDIHSETDYLSPTTLENTYMWYAQAARTRLSPGGIVMNIHTRWHPRDLTGRLLEVADEGGEQWHSIVLPALALENDPLGREPGEALWPERFPVEDLKNIRKLSPASFEALFQQRPTRSATSLFGNAKLIGLYESTFRSLFRGARFRVAWTVDLAISAKEEADFTVFARWVHAQHENSEEDAVLLTHIYRGRKEWPQTKQLILRCMRFFGGETWAFPKQTFELMAVQELRKEGAAPIEQVSLPGDKHQRATVFSSWAMAGRAYGQKCRRREQFWGEHKDFSGVNDAHDDCVDVSSTMTHYFGLSEQWRLLMGKSERIAADNEQERQRERVVMELAR